MQTPKNPPVYSAKWRSRDPHRETDSVIVLPVLAAGVGELASVSFWGALAFALAVHRCWYGLGLRNGLLGVGMCGFGRVGTGEVVEGSYGAGW